LGRRPTCLSHRAPWNALPARGRKSRAFTLVEAVVATIILGAALATLLGLTARAVGSQSRGEHLATAAMLADNQLNLVLATGPEAYPSAFDMEGPFEPPFEDYAYEMTIEPRGVTDPYHVAATILWTRSGRVRSLTVETKIAPRRGDDPDPERAPDELLTRNAS
jgi:type II secretory pathway pseudopilin PulG